jgi:ABC-type antimicrobial peptide transport system ATPase subunit
MPADNIWDAAIAWDRQRRADPNNATINKESTLLVIGNKGVGKARYACLIMGQIYLNAICVYSPL